MTQTQRIERHMREYGSITTLEAFTEYGVTRLSARIFDLRNSGIPVAARSEIGKNRYGEPVHFTRYSLEE